jgi:hypothetical protein
MPPPTLQRRATGPAVRLRENALVAFTLLIAESKPDEREMIFKVIINLINEQNE